MGDGGFARRGDRAVTVAAAQTWAAEQDEASGNRQSIGEMPTQLLVGDLNAVGVMLGIVGDEWNLVLLKLALTGTRRYAAFKAALPISDSVLTNRLSRLVDLGLLRKVRYRTSPPRSEYRLTSRGRGLWPVLVSIWAWELQWVPEHASDSLPLMRHTRCARLFQPVLTCAACRRAVLPRAISARFGPSGSWERSVPSATTRRRSGAGNGDQAGMFPETMTLIGNRWASALLGVAFGGATRFGVFAQQLSAPPAVIADRLRAFCQVGVLEATADQGRADWVSYHLTDKGRAFFPVVATALDWGQRWYASPEGLAVIEIHRGCGATFLPQLACDGCWEPLELKSIGVVPV